MVSAESYFRSLGHRGRIVLFQVPLLATMLLVVVRVVLLPATFGWSPPLILGMAVPVILFGMSVLARGITIPGGQCWSSRFWIADSQPGPRTTARHRFGYCQRRCIRSRLAGQNHLGEPQFSSHVTDALRSDPMAENPTEITIYGRDRSNPLPAEQNPLNRAARGENFTTS
ncbi:hypothetical protein AB0284_05860 [Pseudarthrobacter phenanthrenivorans]|uniref:hypothetical protein n=1 Tax=Pseudarthrobacter phenanthrenivorans TaxID=361575 RepID=UPI00344B041A